MDYNGTMLKTYETSQKIYKFTIGMGDGDLFQLLFLKEKSIYNITLPLNTATLPEATEVLQLNINNVTDNDKIFIFAAERKNYSKSKNVLALNSLHEKCSYSEFFWPVFFLIWSRRNSVLV